ncbi:hypothetical protein SAMN05216551_101341 [Chitinasiproducens palmae]|uniref:Uncharacterized protein n=1 Tax=Chitinasiproducens palmae TaxID=1770053 RepID=A0A1H2PLB0_9BURK|nr:hypothetical protein SAMN05216551_101341 [Chitinasiproducens palmae]
MGSGAGASSARANVDARDASHLARAGRVRHRSWAMQAADRRVPITIPPDVLPIERFAPSLFPVRCANAEATA